MNAYNDLTRVKYNLFEGSTTVTTWDTDLLAWLVTASRLIDKHCERYFYVETATKYYDGSGSSLFIDDLLNITTLKLDEDGDGTFESTMATTDYILYPLNRIAKDMIKVSHNGNYASFASGIKKGVEIVGSWGFGDALSTTPYVDSGTDVNDANVTATVTTITVDDGTKFAAGQTILIDSEQMYIESISSHVLTVKRGVNGTTAATHSDDSDVYIYQYPSLVEQACLIQTMRWYRRRESAFQDQVVSELGATNVYKGLDPDVKLMLNPFIRRSI